MTVRRGPDGRFYRDNVTELKPGDDTFVSLTVTNEDIYHELKTQGKRIGVIESKLTMFHSFTAAVVPTVTAAAGFVTAVYYLRGN